MLDYLSQTLCRGKSSVLPQLDVLYFDQGHGRPSLSGEGVVGKGGRRELQGRGRDWRKEGNGNRLICKINF